MEINGQGDRSNGAIFFWRTNRRGKNASQSAVKERKSSLRGGSSRIQTTLSEGRRSVCPASPANGLPRQSGYHIGFTQGGNGNLGSDEFLKCGATGAVIPRSPRYPSGMPTQPSRYTGYDPLTQFDGPMLIERLAHQRRIEFNRFSIQRAEKI